MQDLIEKHHQNGNAARPHGEPSPDSNSEAARNPEPAQDNAEIRRRLLRRTKALASSREALHRSKDLQRMGRKAGGLVHDFNNLITGILGVTREVSDDLGPASRHQQSLDLILHAAQKAGALS